MTRGRVHPVARFAGLALALSLATALPVPAMAFSLFGGESASAEAPPAPPRPVVTEQVADSAAQGRNVPGVIVAATEVQMAFQTLGRMIDRPVDVGDRVRKGDLLARLDPEDMAASTRAAEAAVASAEVELRTAQNTADRARALADRHVATTAQLESAQQALSAAQSAVAQTRAQLESARDAQGFAIMTAPMDGVISAVEATPGAVVAAGDAILTLASENQVQARIDLIEAQTLGLVPGSRFLVWRDREGDGTPPIEGKVVRIDPVADAQTRTRRVFIALPDDSGLRLGSLIRARPAGTGAASLTVPTGALVAAADGGGQAVWTVSRQADTATVSLRPVQTAGAAGGRTQIIAGLEPGDEVVIRGVHSLTEGQAVGKRVAP